MQSGCNLDVGYSNIPAVPARSSDPERQQDRAYDHHAFHSDAEPGDRGLQLGTRRFNSSKKFCTRISRSGCCVSSAAEPSPEYEFDQSPPHDWEI